MDRAAALRADYDTLAEKLGEAKGSAAAAIVRERRLIAAELETLEKPDDASKRDDLAEQRAKSGAVRPPARRRKSG